MVASEVYARPVPPRAPPRAAHDLGEGRLELGLPEGRAQKVLRIDATGASSSLLGRFLVGSYITGQDQVFITARDGLTTAQRREIHQVVDRLLGTTVVGDTPAVVEVQNFVDPAKYQVPRLIHRVVQMLRTELELCRGVLVGKGVHQFPRIETMEEEVDRFYLLMARQLLLSSESPRIARSIDVENRHYQVGDRLVAKVLEVTGDLIHGLGAELQRNLRGLRRVPRTVLDDFVTRLERLERLLTRTMDAFVQRSAVEANRTLNVIKRVLPKDADFGQVIARRVSNRKVAVAAQRMAYNLDMALEMLIIVNEVTINRSVEPDTVMRADAPFLAGLRESTVSAKVSRAPTREPIGASERRPVSRKRAPSLA